MTQDSMNTTFRNMIEKDGKSKLKELLKKKNVHELPRLKKIAINMGIGRYYSLNKDYTDVLEYLTRITGQKPVVRLSRMAISNFKLRENMPVGLSVTIRGDRMYDFIYRLIHVVLPRVRDFRGLSRNGFDSQGNFSLGVTECSVFPEINPEDITKVHGLQINFHIESGGKEESMALLDFIGLPFKKEA